MNIQHLIEMLACDKRAHCFTCRNRIDGWQFRESVALKVGIETEYVCPFGLPWVEEPAKERKNTEDKHEVLIPPLDLPKLVSEIATDTEADRWIKAIIPQIQDEKRRHEERNEPCKARRCIDKMTARWAEYQNMKKDIEHQSVLT